MIKVTKKKLFIFIIVIGIGLIFYTLLYIPLNTSLKVKQQIKKLHSTDPYKRADAAYELGKMGKNAESAIPHLIKLLNDLDIMDISRYMYPEYIVDQSGSKRLIHRSEWMGSPASIAEDALAKIGIAAVQPILDSIKGKTDVIMAGAALGSMKNPKVLDILIDSLNSNNKYVRNASAQALQKIKDPRTIKPLINSALNDEYSYVRSSALNALEAIKDNSAVEAIIRALKYDGNVSVRRCAAQALGAIKDTRAIAPLIDALQNDKSAKARVFIIYALGSFRDPQALEALVAALKDKDYSVRCSAATALGQIRDKRAVVPLISALKYKINEAIGALGELNDGRAVEPLIDVLKDRNESVRVDAIKALGKIKDHRAIIALINLLNDKSYNVQVPLTLSFLSSISANNGL